MGWPVSDKVRAFIAVDVGEHIRGQVARIQGVCRPAVAGVKWVDPALCHITLNFLGYVPEAQLTAIGAAGRQAAASAAPFELEFQGVGAFPNIKRARVLWMGLGDGQPVLSQLQANLTRELRPLGFEPEDRPFSPHLTIARFKTPANRSLEELLRPFAAEPYGQVRVSDLRLMRSDLRPSGPIYTVIEKFSLG